MKFDLNIINEYIAKGLIEKNDHPSLPLSIYNYTRECQFTQVWDEITLECRGLVLDNEGNVVAKTFRKFFNMEEIPSALIPNEPFEVFEKMDGSLGIVFYYADEWHIATRGSFVSDQAIKGKEMLDKMNTKYGLIPGWTYCMEIIYPENRIVCDYGNEEKLVVLGVINNETGKEGNIDNMISEGWEIVKKYPSTSFDLLKQNIENDKEGYVIRFKSGFRMKIKGAEYVRLHRLLTNFSNIDIWETLKRGDNINLLLDHVPDEFDAWVRKTIAQLELKYDEIKKDVDKQYWELINRKEFAEKVKDNPIRHLLFARLVSYSKRYESEIWDMIRPVYSKPFWNKEEE